jgi:hypothetical protein
MIKTNKKQPKLTVGLNVCKPTIAGFQPESQCLYLRLSTAGFEPLSWCFSTMPRKQITSGLAIAIIYGFSLSGGSGY